MIISNKLKLYPPPSFWDEKIFFKGFYFYKTHKGYFRTFNHETFMPFFDLSKRFVEKISKKEYAQMKIDQEAFRISSMPSQNKGQQTLIF